MHVSSLAIVALSAAFVGGAEAIFTGKATAFTRLAPVESDTCDDIVYWQQDNVSCTSRAAHRVTLAANLNMTPCNATIAVVSSEFRRSISGVRVVDSCIGCGEDDVELSVRAFVDLTGLIPLPSDVVNVMWYVESEPAE